MRDYNKNELRKELILRFRWKRFQDIKKWGFDLLDILVETPEVAQDYLNCASFAKAEGCIGCVDNPSSCVNESYVGTLRDEFTLDELIDMGQIISEPASIRAPRYRGD